MTFTAATRSRLKSTVDLSGKTRSRISRVMKSLICRYRAPVDGRPEIQDLPSPKNFKYQLLLTVRFLCFLRPRVACWIPQESRLKATAVPPLSESENDSKYLCKEGIKKTWHKMRGNDKVGSASKPKVKMSCRLAALVVYTVGIKCLGIKSEIYARTLPEHTFLKASMATNLIKHTYI